MLLRNKLLIFVIFILLVVPMAMACGVEDVKGYAKTAALKYFLGDDDDDLKIEMDELIDLINFYLNIPENQTTADCAYRGNSGNSITNIMLKIGSIDIPTCEPLPGVDGTAQWGDCHPSVQPFYCRMGVFEPNCDVCGCPGGPEYCTDNGEECVDANSQMGVSVAAGQSNADVIPCPGSIGNICCDYDGYGYVDDFGVDTFITNCGGLPTCDAHQSQIFQIGTYCNCIEFECCSQAGVDQCADCYDCQEGLCVLTDTNCCDSNGVCIIPLDECSTLDQQDSYYHLSGDINATGGTDACFTILADGITFDLNGFTITGPGPGTTQDGIVASGDGATIRGGGGTVTNFRNGAVVDPNPCIEDPGIAHWCTNSYTVQNMNYSDNDRYGVLIYPYPDVPDNPEPDAHKVIIDHVGLFRNGFGGLYSQPDSLRNVLLYVTANNNGHGSGEGDGIFIEPTIGNSELKNVIARDNKRYGIHLDSTSDPLTIEMTNTEVCDNTNNNIFCETGSYITLIGEGNTCTPPSVACGATGFTYELCSSDPVHHYAFEGDAQDSVVVGFVHGTLMNGATTIDDPERGGKVLSLDGINDYIYFGNAFNSDLSGAFTISAWVKLDVVALASEKESYIFWKQNDRPGLTIRGDGDCAWLDMKHSSHDQGGAIITNGVCLVVDTWYHMTYVFDGTWLRGYVDGIGTGSGYVDTSSPYSPGGQVYIGRNEGTSDSFKGVIDELKIWNYALSADGVNDLYNEYG